jgi:hypothetical protein
MSMDPVISLHLVDYAIIGVYILLFWGPSS